MISFYFRIYQPEQLSSQHSRGHEVNLNKGLNTMKIFFFYFNRVKSLFFSFKFFAVLNELVGFIFELFDDFLVVSYFAQKLSVDGLFVEIFVDQIFSVSYALNKWIYTVAVLIYLKANSTVLNFSISLSILSLSILLTKIWVRNIFLHCF